MIQHKLGFISLFLALLIGCNSGNDGNPPFPLDGLDDNANGIRDDIDNHINATYLSERERNVVAKQALALQKALMINTNDSESVNNLVREIARTEYCIHEIFTDLENGPLPGQVSREIESLTTNTKERLIEYLSFNSSLSGKILTMPTEIECDE